MATFMKKQTPAFYLYAIAAVLMIVGLVGFFSVDPGFTNGYLVADSKSLVLGCGIASIVLTAVHLALVQINLGNYGSLAANTLAILVSVLMMTTLAAGMLYAGIYSMAMALGSVLGDNTSTNVYITFLAVSAAAWLVSVVAAFFKPVKQEG